MTRGSARSQWPAPRTVCSSEGPVAASASARASASGTSGSSEPWTIRSGRPFNKRGVLRRMQHGELLGPRVDRGGELGCGDHPGLAAPGQQVLGIARERAEAGRGAQAGHAGNPLVAGRQVERQHAAEAEADHEARGELGDLGGGHEGQVLQPAQG